MLDLNPLPNPLADVKQLVFFNKSGIISNHNTAGLPVSINLKQICTPNPVPHSNPIIQSLL